MYMILNIMGKMCMTLSMPNSCSVTIFEYSSTDVSLLSRCLLVLSEHLGSVLVYGITRE